VSYILRTHSNHQSDAREVADSSLLIGRAGSSHLRLADGAVDFQHARIDEIDGQFVLSDEGSASGTYVNGKKIQNKILANGDRILIGPHLLIAAIGSPGEPLCLDVAPEPVERRSRAGPLDAPSFPFSAAYALNRWFWNKTVATLLVTLGCALLLIMPIRAGRQELFQAQPVADGHALFAGQCSRCHLPWRGSSEQRCQECHSGTIHHDRQTFVPSCLECHREHQGNQSLTAVANQQCVKCHNELKTRDGKPPGFEPRVTDFTTGHPEFTFTVNTLSQQRRLRLSDKGARQADPTRLKLNHVAHLKPNLKGPKGPTRLFCKDCHAPAPDGTLFSPIRYEAHCKDCHQLEFDPALPGRVVPHAPPEIVDAYLRGLFANNTRQSPPRAAGTNQDQDRATPVSAQVAPMRNLRETEARVFKDSCGLCHQIDFKNLPLPKIEPPDVPDRWFQHARFSHRSHRVLECNACHTRASRSRRTADVLIPGIEICQGCHRQADQNWLSPVTAAPTACITCHVYHTQGTKGDWDGPQTVRGLLEGNESKPISDGRQVSSFKRYVKKLATFFERQ
jgi:FHA domain